MRLPKRWIEIQWQHRWGRFKGIERDTISRRQVMPVKEPPVDRQTHNTIADLHDRRANDA